MARALILFLIGSTLVTSALSFCCTNTGWFQCCSHGPCNIFCCNCDGSSCQSDCAFDMTLVTGGISAGFAAFGIGKRNANNVELLERSKRALANGKGDPTLSKFHFLDINGDGTIDLEETMAYALLVELENELAEANLTERSRRKRSPSMVEQDFNAMDVNKDGKIEEEEFDVSLKK